MRTRPLLVGVACLLLLAGTRTAAQESPSGRFSELSLAVTTNARSLIPYEALDIVITLKNETDGVIRGHTLLDPGMGFVRIYVAGDGGPFLEHASAIGYESYVHAKPWEIPKGYQENEEVRLWYGVTGDGPRKALFREPGSYKIKCVMKELDGKGAIESNVLEVAVRAPEGQDAEALRYIADREAAGNFFFFSGARHPKKQPERVKELEEFIARFPESRYAAYARYACAKTRASAKEYDEAQPMFETLADAKEFPFRDEALYWLVAIEAKRAATAAARAKRYFDAMKTDYPDNMWTFEATNEVTILLRELPRVFE